MRIFLLKTIFLFCIIVTVLKLDAQTSFITAGQTAGMMVTKYNPPQFIWWPADQSISLYDTGSVEIDLNHDGVVDVVIVYNFQYIGAEGSEQSFYINAPNLRVQLAYVSVADSNAGCPDTVAYPDSRLFSTGDTLRNTGLWCDTLVNIYGFSYEFGGFGCTNGKQPPENFYLAGRLCVNNDTSLFYVHINQGGTAGGTLLDYAIQGHDTTINLSSISSLPVDNDPLKIFPNPVLNTVHILVNKEQRFELSNILGENVKEGKLDNGDNQLDMTDLSNGVYFLTTSAGQGRMVRKILKTRFK